MSQSLYRIKMELEQRRLFGYRLVLISTIICSLLSDSTKVYAQHWSLNMGTTHTSTPFRTSEFVRTSSYALTGKVTGWYIGLGKEWFVKEKSSLNTELAVYTCGGEIVEIDGGLEGPAQVWNLDNDRYSYNRVSLNSDYAMQVWSYKNLKINALVGLHLDYLLYFKPIEVDFWLPDACDDPLRLAKRFGALRKFNIGPNLGASLVQSSGAFQYSLRCVYAPRWFKMAKYSREVDAATINGINAISAEEQVSYLTLGVGYNFKKK